MRRTALRHRKPLQARSRLRARPKPRAPRTVAEEAWKIPQSGYCQCGCDRFSIHLHRHHVVTQATVRREGGDPWAIANSMLLHPDCHMRHHSAFHRIPLPSVPQDAVDFAVRLLGVDRAALYFARFYGPELAGGRWRP